MPSLANAPVARAARAEALRERGEFALRLIALAALVLLVLVVAGVFIPTRSNSKSAVLFATAPGVKASSLSALLQRLVISERPLPSLHVDASVVPSDTVRSLMSAANAIGIPVSWTDSTKNAAMAIEATALIDPKGGVALRASAPAGAALAFRDSVGLIDSVHVRSGGGAITVGRVSGSVMVTANAARAQTDAPAPVTIRRILLIGAPGWESKFTMAALEERGWGVDARYSLGRNVSVTQGDPTVPDTARYAAVVALDSTALPQVAAIKRYVQSGGGLLLAGAAATLREFGELLPGKAGAEQAGIPGALGTDAPQQAFSWRPLAPDSNALVIARSSRARSGDRNATIVARRYGAGRVVEVAYSDVWQWRMAGPDGSVDAHRQWWGALIAMVAYAPEIERANVESAVNDVDNLPGNAAPYADMLARFGKSVAVPPPLLSNAAQGKFWETLLLCVALVALLMEWASRRLRGAR
ncbi:MAG: hypothetical protein ABJC26_00085 [Gemmatimonadaceae bacterium]